MYPKANDDLSLALPPFLIISHHLSLSLSHTYLELIPFVNVCVCVIEKLYQVQMQVQMQIDINFLLSFVSLFAKSHLTRSCCSLWHIGRCPHSLLDNLQPDLSPRVPTCLQGFATIRRNRRVIVIHMYLHYISFRFKIVRFV